MNKHLKQFNYLLAVTLAIVTIAPQAVIAQSEFSRSPNVQLGNFWNPNGIIYGYLGDFARNDTGRSQQSSLAAVSYHESAVNQNVSLVHRFSDGWLNNFDGTFTTRLNRLKETADADTRPMYSTGTPTLAHITALLDDNPAEIARVRAWANEYSASDIGPMFVRLAHESDRPNRPWNGNPQLFIDWWQKFVTIVETDAPGYEAPTDLIWVWSPTEFRFNRSFAGNIVPVSQSYANNLYPGADYVDWVGSSGYDFPCAVEGTINLHNNTHEGVLEHATLWASIFAPEKPFILAEWGSEVEERGNGGSRAEFFNSTREMLRSTAPGFNQIGAIVYFDRDHGTDGCNWSFHNRVTFPNPELPFDQGANAQIAVGDDADFFAYRNLINTPDMIAPLGAFNISTTSPEQLVANAQELSIVAGESLPIELTGVDPAGETLLFELVSEPTKGTLQGTPPNLTYTPAADSSGRDSFEFRVSANGQFSESALVGIEVQPASCAPECAAPVAAVLPGSRSILMNSTATVFATIVNPADRAALACRIELDTALDIDFEYRSADPLTNSVSGEVNPVVDMSPQGSSAFVLALTPREAFTLTQLEFNFICANSGSASVAPGINTLSLSSSIDPIADIVAIALTPSANGIAEIGTTNFGVYAVATSNLGADAIITATPATGSWFSGEALICETQPITGECMAPPASSVEASMGALSTASFGVFVRGNAAIALDPTNHRQSVRFVDSSGNTRGLTSVALATAP